METGSHNTVGLKKKPPAPNRRDVHRYQHIKLEGADEEGPESRGHCH
jgi:hypothetical protein